MCNDYTRCHIELTVTAAEAAVIAAAIRISNAITCNEKVQAEAEARENCFFRSDYPGTADNPLADFLALFPDPDLPIFGVSITRERQQGDKGTRLTIEGDDAEVDALAQLLFNSACSTLPIELAYDVFHHPDDSEPARRGFALITQNAVIFGDRAANYTGLCGPGYVITIDNDDADEPTLFWNEKDGFGDAGTATIFQMEEIDMLCLPFGSTRWMALPQQQSSAELMGAPTGAPAIPLAI